MVWSRELRIVAEISTPAGTRRSGPGICGLRPSSAKAETTSDVFPASLGYQIAGRASRRTFSTPLTREPAGTRLSLQIAVGVVSPTAGLAMRKSMLLTMSNRGLNISFLHQLTACGDFAGEMLWFIRKRLVGSYLAFNCASR